MRKHSVHFSRHGNRRREHLTAKAFPLPKLGIFPLLIHFLSIYAFWNPNNFLILIFLAVWYNAVTILLVVFYWLQDEVFIVQNEVYRGQQYSQIYFARLHMMRTILHSLIPHWKPHIPGIFLTFIFLYVVNLVQNL